MWWQLAQLMPPVGHCCHLQPGPHVHLHGPQQACRTSLGRGFGDAGRSVHVFSEAALLCHVPFSVPSLPQTHFLCPIFLSSFTTVSIINALIAKPRSPAAPPSSFHSHIRQDAFAFFKPGSSCLNPYFAMWEYKAFTKICYVLHRHTCSRGACGPGEPVSWLRRV